MRDLLGSWPDEPHVYERRANELDSHVTPQFFDLWAFSGCTPAEEIAVMNHGANPPKPSINPVGFKTNGRTDGLKLRRYHEAGYTIRLGNLQRVVPFLNSVSRQIQMETGYSNYLHAFLTPPGGQGLRHHWDQQMALIVQISGTKTWELWAPKFPSPMRNYAESTRVWDETWRHEWESHGPDHTIELEPGQTLLLPRGWVHNPHSRNASEDSIHLTFAIRERTHLWLAEKLTAKAIGRPEFRDLVIPPELHGDDLSSRLEDTRRMLVRFLASLDLSAEAEEIRLAALSELEYTT
ncbi:MULTISPECIES: JmjC domain-containing protein [Streptomyces]|uniref:Cupin domain-containing protein n=1 Tax=Streptomyces evansiae TaxID=3075535 RepID=A0ABU2R0J4_9ACTN|nr:MULTISPECIES: cupin domain-containing protein [unclassified Streptomyces]MDT0409867.1 cupin domain-containing protein [Streptomyces sp. DSM 41979]